MANDLVNGVMLWSKDQDFAENRIPMNRNSYYGSTQVNYVINETFVGLNVSGRTVTIDYTAGDYKNQHRFDYGAGDPTFIAFTC